MKKKSLPRCHWMAAGAPRKFPMPCETWLERKEQPAQPTGSVTVFCQGNSCMLLWWNRSMGSRCFSMASPFQAHPFFYCPKVPYQEATEESKGRHLAALEVKQGPDMTEKPKTQGVRETASQPLRLSSQ